MAPQAPRSKARAGSSPDPAEKRWRPKERRKRPACGYSFDGAVCRRSGPHYCKPRADRVVATFAEVLVHTKGRWARRAFVLDWWQEHEIIRPLFGEVLWSDEWDRYVRRYRLAYIILGRKNGKSELVAGMVLVLLVADDEASAEVYGAAKDTKQAGKVADVVNRMRELQPLLNDAQGGRLGFNKNSRRIFDPTSGSFFEVITADALGELGHNPHGAYIDEVLSQPDDGLFNTLRTAMGAREQPLFVLISTETNDPNGFGAVQIDEAERIVADPARAPHVFAYVRKAPQNTEELRTIRRVHRGHPDLPVSIDPWDEANWRWPNPALGSFKTIQSMREEALEARNDPTKENAFRQFHLNQRVNQVSRYLPSDLWKRNAGEILLTPDDVAAKIEGVPAWAGLDLSAKLDLTAWTVLTDDLWAWWRIWCPEAIVPRLDEATGGQFSLWCRDGWVTITDGDTIDYEQVYADIEADHDRFRIAEVTYDKWSGEPVRQELERRTGLELFESSTTYEKMTAPMQELMRVLRARELNHGGNPVAAWMASNLAAKYPRDDPDRVRPVKPPRDRSGVRIDGMITLLMALDGWMRHREEEASVYETRGIATL
jgi:phage terminase large subunit-like protein